MGCSLDDRNRNRLRGKFKSKRNFLILVLINLQLKTVSIYQRMLQIRNIRVTTKKIFKLNILKNLNNLGLLINVSN